MSDSSPPSVVLVGAVVEALAEDQTEVRRGFFGRGPADHVFVVRHERFAINVLDPHFPATGRRTDMLT